MQKLLGRGRRVLLVQRTPDDRVALEIAQMHGRIGFLFFIRRDARQRSVGAVHFRFVAKPKLVDGLLDDLDERLAVVGRRRICKSKRTKRFG